MEDTKDKTTEGIAEAIVEATSTIKIGDVIVSSSLTDLNGILNVVDWLFKQKDIKEYLGLVQAKKTGASYMG